MDSLGNIFLASAISRVKYYKILAEKTFGQLEDRDFHYQPDPQSNSIAIIIQHMSGNMLSRWTGFLTEDGEKNWRNRDKEFNSREFSRAQLMEIWEKGWNCFIDALQSLKEEDLLKTIHIRTESLIALDAINRQIAHYPYHVGQIVYIGKLLRGNKWQSLSIAKGKSDDYNRMMSENPKQ
ncbi:MAG: DUF1572 family protein [Sphingobacteriales bacterium]|nr:DUF1572 family protein [Sphingobacteriales bacterium]OJY82511.1 MAG: hypothetical protein BGP14_17945 [Sphingobacteriales bacterium 44-15]